MASMEEVFFKDMDDAVRVCVRISTQGGGRKKIGERDVKGLVKVIVIWRKTKKEEEWWWKGMERKGGGGEGYGGGGLF